MFCRSNSEDSGSLRLYTPRCSSVFSSSGCMQRCLWRHHHSRVFRYWTSVYVMKEPSAAAPLPVQRLSTSTPPLISHLATLQSPSRAAAHQADVFSDGIQSQLNQWGGNDHTDHSLYIRKTSKHDTERRTGQWLSGPPEPDLGADLVQ